MNNINEMRDMAQFLLMISVVPFAFLFFFYWHRERRHQRDHEDQRREEEQQYRKAQQKRDYQHDIESQSLLRGQEEKEERNRKMQEDLFQSMKAQQSSGPGSGGYIVLELPNDQIAAFNDLLKGFEDFAKIKGYEIRFSSDTTFPNKIAFKFTLGDEGVNVSTEKVREDLREYIQKVQSGAPLDDLPITLPEPEHDLLLTLMKNRINFLQHNYNLKKNTIEFYEKIIDKFLANPMGILPAPNVTVQTGGNMDSRKYNSIDSSHVIQGDNNRLIDSSIKINGSYNERKNQIDKLSELIDLLKSETKTSTDDRDNAILNLEKVKDEMTDEENPDESRVKKWLGKVLSCFKNLELAKATIDKAKELYDSFGLSDLLSDIF